VPGRGYAARSSTRELRDAAEEDSEDSAPDFDVEAAATRLPDGYSIELRWPLAALRFPHAGGAPWRVMVARNIPRKERTLDVSAPALTKDTLSFIAELQPLDDLGDLALQVRERSFVAFRPELTLRATRDSSEADGPREFSGIALHEHEAQLHPQETRTLADPLLGVAAGQIVDRLAQPGFWFAAARNTGVWGHVGLDSHRARSDGPLHATRTLLLGFESSPGELLSYVNAEVEWGRRLDFDADRVGLGAQGQLQAQLRTPLPAGLWLELERRLGLGWVHAPDGRRAFTDRSAQSLVVLHLRPRESLRLIYQQTRLNRRADSGASLAAQDDRGRVLALMFQHRIGLSRVISLGLNRAREQPGGVRADEVFAKATLGY
jgi:hypothetical protein